jgi:hypothetical protein
MRSIFFHVVSKDGSNGNYPLTISPRKQKVGRDPESKPAANYSHAHLHQLDEVIYGPAGTIFEALPLTGPNSIFTIMANAFEIPLQTILDAWNGLVQTHSTHAFREGVGYVTGSDTALDSSSFVTNIGNTAANADANAEAEADTDADEDTDDETDDDESH